MEISVSDQIRAILKRRRNEYERYHSLKRLMMFLDLESSFVVTIDRLLEYITLGVQCGVKRDSEWKFEIHFIGSDRNIDTIENRLNYLGFENPVHYVRGLGRKAHQIDITAIPDNYQCSEIRKIYDSKVDIARYVLDGVCTSEKFLDMIKVRAETCKLDLDFINFYLFVQFPENVLPQWVHSMGISTEPCDNKLYYDASVWHFIYMYR